VAVGRRRDELGITSLGFCAETLAWMSSNFERAPDMVNIIEPEVPTKRELVGRLRERNPDLLVVWLPRVVLHPLSWLGLGLQRVLRPGVPAINVAKVFAPERYDASASEMLARQMSAEPTGLPRESNSADPQTESVAAQEAHPLGEIEITPMKPARRR
jgi:hypothetical protein